MSTASRPLTLSLVRKRLLAMLPKGVRRKPPHAANDSAAESSHGTSTAMPHGFETFQRYPGEKAFRKDAAKKAAVGWRLASSREGSVRRTIEAHYLRP